MKWEFIFTVNRKYPSYHYATMCELLNDDLFSAWFARSIEGSEDSVIMGARLRK